MAYGIKVNGVDLQDVYASASDVGGTGGFALYGWGGNSNYETGLVPARTTYIPALVSTKSDWKKISSDGYGVSVGIKVDGTLWAWGTLGTDKLYKPSIISTASWKDAAGTTLLKSDNTIWWLKSFSELVQFSPDTDWESISKTAAIKSNGTLWTWGDNTYGQLGIGASAYKSSPTQVGSLTNWKQVSNGAYHTVAVKTDGTLWGWGYNSSGQLGLSDLAHRSSPTQVGTLTNWKNVFADNSYNTFAIKTDGTLWAWGNNAWSELGVTAGGYRSSPAQVGSATNWKAIFPSGNQIHGITTDGTLYGWGNNTYGSVGNGTTNNQTGTLLTLIQLKNCVGIAENRYGVCALQQI